MLNTLRNNFIRAAGLKSVLAALLLTGTGAATAGTVTVDLCAKAGTTSGTVITPAIPVWGYALGDCTSAPVLAAPGGPVITVAAGDVVTVNLHNSLPEATGLIFQGQTLVTDTTGAGAGTGLKSYTFTASSAGTFLYQAAPLPNAEHQTAMGLYGALVVSGVDVAVRTVTATFLSGDTLIPDTTAAATEKGLKVSGGGIAPGTTVASVDPGVSFTLSQAATFDGTSFVLSKGSTYGATFDEQTVMVLSEIDPALNTSATPATFDMRNFAPKYFLINGNAYPDTAEIASVGGHKLLVRYVNAGARHHSMGVLGLRQNFIAKDGSLLPTADVAVTAETLATGQTGDALISVPAISTVSRYAVYDANLSLHNSSASGFGGMLTFVNAAGAPAASSGPTTTGVAVSPTPTIGNVDVSLTASVTSGEADGVTAVEYFLDTKGGNGAGTAMAPGAAPTYSATIASATLTGLSSGNHTFYVHGQDANGWGGYSFTVLNLDKTGPTTSALVLTPNPSNGTGNVTLTASASDVATGGSNVIAAQYTIDGGTVVAFAPSGAAAPVRSLTATFASPTGAGPHTIAVRSQDALGNWGLPVSATLTVTTAGPTTTIISVSPNPANGVQGANTSSSVVRVTASMTSGSATITGAEAFVDCGLGTPSNPCANGTGFPLVPADGLFNAATEVGYGDIPLTTVALLTAGNHTIYVHGRDSAGNWGTKVTAVLVVNRSAPTVTNVLLTPAYTNNGAVVILANATDAATGNNNIQRGEYFVDVAGGPGTGISLARTSNSPTTRLIGFISGSVTGGLSAGTHTVYVRALDVAGNWGAVFGATLTIDRTAPTFVSIVRNGPSPTGANSVSFTVRFSESVTNISAADFQVIENLPGNLQVNVSGTGATRIVTVSTGGNGVSGSIGLNIRNNATIADLAGNAWAASAVTGPVYVIDKVAPTFSSITLTPNTISPGTASVALTVTNASDGTAGSGVVGGEWWIGNNNIANGTGTEFAAGAGTTSGIVIPTDSLTGGSYTVRVRLIDAAGNWSGGNNGVRTATLRVVLPNPVALNSVAFGGSVKRTGSAAQRTATLTITLSNANTQALTGVTLTDNLPQPSGGGSSLIVLNGASSTCGGNIQRQNNNRRLAFSGGTIAAGGTCTITASIQLSANAGAASGYTLTNTIPVGGATATNAGSSPTAASAVLAVNP